MSPNTSWSVFHVSDPHIGMPEAGGDKPGTIRTRLQAALARVLPIPDLIIVTGDITHHGSTSEQRRAHAIFDSLGVPVAMVPGNHDGPALGGSISDEQDADHGPKGAWKRTFGPATIIGLNSVVPGQSHGQLGADQLSWLEKHLADTMDQPSFIALHHPPFRVGLQAIDEAGLADSSSLLRLVRTHPVTAILAGHAHHHVAMHAGTSPVFVAPSLSWRTAPDFRADVQLTPSPEPPAGLLHRWSADHGHLTTHAVILGTGSEFARL